MAKKINEKTSGISLAGFQPRMSPGEHKAAETSPNTVIRDGAKSFTGAGIFMSAITGKDEVSKELAEVHAKLDVANRVAAEFNGAKLVRALDARLVKPSHWANRSEAAMQSKDFGALKLEIENSGGNVQPIKVRPKSDGSGEFEIVYGHRRHRACLELGLPVLAFIEPLTDAELFVAMDRENRQRADLRPYEQGVMYARALDDGLFPSLRRMADALGVDAGNASKAIFLARMPEPVLSAFNSPMDIQQAWATPLSAALQKDPDFVLKRAVELRARNPRPTSMEVFRELTGHGVVSNNTMHSKPVSIKGKGGRSGTIDFNPKKQTFEIRLVGLGEIHLKAIEDAIKALLA